MKQTLILLLFAVNVVIAQPRWMEKRPHGEPMMHRGAVMEKLDLTADQQKQFEKLQTELQKDQIGLRSKVQLARIDLRELFRDEKPDKGKIESKMSEISKLQNEMKLARVGFWFDVNKMLTADQQKTWKKRPMMSGGMNGPGEKKIVRKRMMMKMDGDDDEDDDKDEKDDD